MTKAINGRMNMYRVRIKTFGSANRSTGWNSCEVELAKKRITIEEVLKSAQTQDGIALFDLITHDHELKKNHAIFLSGRLLQKPVDLQMNIKNGDEILILDFPFTLGGG